MTSALSLQTNVSMLDRAKPFIFGCLAGMTGQTISHPMDTVKVRIQVGAESSVLLPKSSLKVLSLIARQEGVSSLYKGLDCALIRQLTYGTTRLGVYKSLFAWRTDMLGGQMPFYEKIVIGMTAGFIGSIVGSPADLTLVRFQSDQTLPTHLRRNYTSFFHAFKKIISEDGVVGLWTGVTPTMLRAMLICAGQLATFEEAREQTAAYRQKNDFINTLVAVGVSCVVMSLVSLPVDNCKIKMMRMARLPNGSFPYSGISDCMIKTVRNEGFFGLWTGLRAVYMRDAPHTIVTLLTLDFLSNKFRNANSK